MTSSSTMCDLFASKDVVEVLKNKFVVIIGDSIQRGIYKDLILMLQGNRYLTQADLKAKGEFTFAGDKLIEGGRMGKMNNGTGYREVREYLDEFHLVRFYFTTRCYSGYMEGVLEDLEDEPRPDVVIMNSCLWDITRYGRTAIVEYKENLKVLFSELKRILPKETLVIWNTTLPISKNARGGFLVPEIEYRNSTLRLDVLEANYYAHGVAVENGFDVIDLHYHFRLQLHRRAEDGIHWDMDAHRRMTNIILSHVCDAWGLPLPQNAPRMARGKDREDWKDGRHYDRDSTQYTERCSEREKIPIKLRLGHLHESENTTSSSSSHYYRKEDRGGYEWQDYPEEDTYHRKERARRPKYRSRPYTSHSRDY